MTALTCVDCATGDGVAIDRLCAPCRFARGASERAAQGLGPFIDDGGVLEQLAQLLEFAPAVTSEKATAPAESHSGGTVSMPAAG